MRKSVANEYISSLNCQKSSNLQMEGNKSIAVLTSGGDSQGMNATVRAVVRAGIHRKCKVYIVYEGYEGLINGNIQEAFWDTVSDIIDKGGTFIGSARSEKFRQKEGRKMAALNLLKLSIHHLIVIGGDGSLQGLSILYEEWPILVGELEAVAKISPKSTARLNVVGIVGSIDNDFVGTDRTIGTDSALSRITECIDSLVDTANSHQRAFIIEVMGGGCGHLALTTSLALEADYVFLPESPPDSDWRITLCEQLKQNRTMGRRLNLVIIAEGAVDSKGTRITPSQVKEAIVNTLHFDTRITQLGHIQRGGHPTFLDRLLGSRMGFAAVRCILTDDCTPKVLCLKGHTIKMMPLIYAVNKTKQVSESRKSRDFGLAARLRGEGFLHKKSCIEFMSDVQKPIEGSVKTYAVIHVGSPVAGMNSVTHAFTRVACHSNIRVLGIENSWDGLKQKKYRLLTPIGVSGWMCLGGSELGSKRQLPSGFAQIASSIAHLSIEAILIIGGFEAFESATMLLEEKANHKELDIRIVVIPAAAYNNVPGTCFSLGSDTALNEICRQINNMRENWRGCKEGWKLVEISGIGSYLAVMAAISTGADAVLIEKDGEQKLAIKKIIKDAKYKLNRGIDQFFIVRSLDSYDTPTNEEPSMTLENMNPKVLRVCSLGASQNGGRPSAFDRQMALRMAIYAFKGISKPQDKNIVDVLGLSGRKLTFTPVSDLVDRACFSHQVPLRQWWMDLVPLVDHLSRLDKESKLTDEKLPAK